jgi:glycosyltransferase involved in cell wall biosynthesis
MAAGLPIIAIGGTGSEEVVGDAGLMVPPRDVEGLRGALRRLLDDPDLRSTLGSRARARLDARFSWRAIAEQYLDLYRRCAA